MRPLAFALAFALIDALASTARAQPADDADTEARAEFERGRDAYAEGEFDVALHAFERAYELSGRAELLYNVAMTYDRLRNDARAIEHFEAYLEQAPDADNRRSVERRLVILKQHASEGRAEPDGGGVSPWPFIVLGGGAVLGALSGVFWALANGADGDLAVTCAPTCSDEAIGASSGPAFVTATNVLLVAAIVAGAGGAVWLVIDLVTDEDGRDQTGASIELGPTGVRGRF